MVEGGYLDYGEAQAGPSGSQPAEVKGERRSRRRGSSRARRLSWLAAVAAASALGVLGALALTGVFDGASADKTTGVAAYKAAVKGYCSLALAGQDPNPGPTPQQRAAAYLEVIETMRGRLESLSPPASSDLALERFRQGLSSAADSTSIVAEHPPAAGTQAQATVVAELTFAAGQVQAGALGYGLGSRCVAIGGLVARSARNAAGAP